mmetsp:Transcript_17093/g.32145  ORF Transcript_17093/g.32145 Transcript_17093/m.32145 type:complete len:201 (+) Transcript_17093:186-788(+)
MQLLLHQDRIDPIWQRAPTVCCGQTIHAVNFVSMLGGQAKANLSCFPIIHRVITVQHRFTENEKLGAQRLGHRHRHHPRPAVPLRCRSSRESALRCVRWSLSIRAASQGEETRTARSWLRRLCSSSRSHSFLDTEHGHCILRAASSVIASRGAAARAVSEGRFHFFYSHPHALRRANGHTLPKWQPSHVCFRMDGEAHTG